MNRILLTFLVALLILGWGYWSDTSHFIASYWTQGVSDQAIARAGQWGDSFGAFNAFVSAIAFATVAATLMIQSKALKDQAQDLHRERFESTFFELLHLTRELRKEVTYRYSADYKKLRSAGSSSFKIIGLSSTRSDISAFQAANLEIVFWLRQNKVADSPQVDDVVNIYMKRVHSSNEATLGRYFRIIYTILFRIYNDNKLEDNEKIRYANLLRSQLSSYEILLLAANGLCPVSKDMRKYIVHFRMLKYMAGAANRRRYTILYGDEAFAERD